MILRFAGALKPVERWRFVVVRAICFENGGLGLIWKTRIVLIGTIGTLGALGALGFQTSKCSISLNIDNEKS